MNQQQAVSSFSWQQPHVREHDPRTPLWTVSFKNDEQVYGFYFLDISVWIDLLVWLIGGAMFAALFSPIVYYTLIQPRRQTQHSYSSPEKKDDSKYFYRDRHTPMLPSTASCLWTFGFLIPFWIFVPIRIVDSLECSSEIFRFAALSLPICSTFRILEALFGYIPHHHEQAWTSVSQYALYFAWPVIYKVKGDSDIKASEFERETTYVPISFQYLMHTIVRFNGYVLLCGLLNSCFRCLSPTYFPNFGQSINLTSYGDADLYTLGSIFNLRRQKDSLLYGILFQLTLATHGIGLQLLCSLLTGRQVDPLMKNPLALSKSATEFWGRRWNNVIHECLKNGIYKPVRFSLQKGHWLAMLAAFVASGMFHECLLPCAFSKLSVHSRRHGGTMIFFLWQAGLVAIEQQLQRFVSQSSSKSAHPFKNNFRILMQKLNHVLNQYPFLRTLFMIFAGLPLSHFFLESYVKSDFFLLAQVTYPMISPVSTQSKLG